MRLMKTALLVISFMLIGALAAVFALQNNQPVSVNLLVSKQDIVLGPLLLFVFIAGGVLGVVSSSWAILRLQTRQMRLRRQLRTSEQTLSKIQTNI